MTIKSKYFFYSIFFQYLALGMVFPVVVAWQNQQGLNFSQIGWVVGLGLALLLILDPVSSYISDIYSKKMVIVAGLFCLIISSLLLVLNPGFGIFALFVIMQNTGLALLSGTQESFLHDSWNKNDGGLTKLISKMHIYDEVGVVTGALLSSLFITLFDPKISFAISAAVLAIALVFILLVHIKPITSAQSSSAMSSEIFLQFITHIQHYRRTTFVLFLGTIAILTFRSEILYQKSLLVVGLSLGAFGLIYALAKTFSILGSSLASTFEEKWGTFVVINYLFILQTIGITLLLFGYTWLTVASLCMFYFLENVFRGVFRSWILTNTPTASKTLYLSLFNTTSLGIWALMNPLVGVALDKSIFIAVICLAVLRVGAIIIMNLAKSKLIFQRREAF